MLKKSGLLFPPLFFKHVKPAPTSRLLVIYANDQILATFSNTLKKHSLFIGYIIAFPTFLIHSLLSPDNLF